MASDENYIITLQDVDGINIDGSNYKFNGGDKITLEVTRFIIDLPTKVDLREKNNRRLDSTMQYSDLIAEHSFAGPSNMSIKISGVIWADDLERPRNPIGKPIDIMDLHNMRVFNHRIYLKDFQSNNSNVLTPIHTLINKTDLLGNTVGDSVKGLPVVVSKISNISRGNDSEKGIFITYSLDLEEDK
jgi:hypothetical protein